MQKGRISEEFDYLNGNVVELYHGFFCRIMLKLIDRVYARGLVHAVLLAQKCGQVYPLFVGQTTWFGMLGFVTRKESGFIWQIILDHFEILLT